MSIKEKNLSAHKRMAIWWILHYLTKHPDAKDTLEGVLKWWLPKEYVGRSDEVQAALDFLTTKSWLTKQETIGLQKIYGINQEQLDDIKAFQRSVKEKAEGNDVCPEAGCYPNFRG